ncbi:MAG: coproporphyrinogen III oxidase [Proteobacteria bacterium]|nr:coproporphyrinogen III oxidase [Pseudomonadota bacterium]
MSDVVPPLPDLAVYVHWPYCARICPYCDFNVVRARGREAEAAALAEAVVADIEAQARRIGPRRLISIFFGGGTPSLMDPAALSRIVATAKSLFEPAPDLEITLEANPTDAEAERFRAFAEAGVQRLSLGVQSLDDAALEFLGRNHGAAEAERAARAAADAFPRLSIDLIYARPDQTVEGWRRELGQALDWAPEHVSPYQLTIEPTTAFGRAAARGQLRPPDDDLGADLYDATQAVLEEAGFEAYEVSNHARGEAARSRHNLAIWRGAEYLGAGPGAHGRVVLDGARTATVGARRITDYLAQVEKTGVGFEVAERLSPRDAAEERVLLGLRIDEGVALSALRALGLQTATAPVADLLEAGFLRIDSDRIAAMPAGRLVLDRVIAELLTA